MVREYVRKTEGPKWDEETMRKAVLDVCSGKKCGEVARLYDVPRQTLQKKVEKYKKDENAILSPNPGTKPIFSKRQEDILASIFQLYESRKLGFTSSEARQIAYRLALDLNLKNKFSDPDQLAGKDWLQNFMKRNPQLSLKKPEKTSTSRIYSFTESSMNKFYDLLEKTMKENNITSPDQVWNCDETPVSTVPKGWRKVIATKGSRQVGTMTHGERGEHVTAHICFSAAGKYMPPLVIFPRKKFNSDFLKGKPEGSTVEFYPSGYMTSDIFHRWMSHFISFTKPSPDRKMLLTFDGHTTHTKNLPALELARSSNVVCLVFPAHTTHKVQPVDTSFNKPLSTEMASESIRWTRSKHKKKRSLTIKNLFEIFTPAYLRAAKPENAISGFRRAGIFPFNRHAFTDKDYEAGTLIDHTTEQLEPLGIVYTACMNK